MNTHSTAHGRIAGVVAAVPSRVITNADCPDPQAADEAAKITGVYQRRWVSPHQSARTLCTDAARHLLASMGWDPKSIGVVVYVTQTPEGHVPADVYRMAADLGLSDGVACLQVNWSCAGYVYGLWTAMRLLQPGQRALLLVGDANSRISDPYDRATAPLFGDAGSATAIEGGGPEQHFFLGTDGSGANSLCQRCNWLEMDGGAVFKFTLQRVPPLVADVLACGRPDLVLMHQANRYMLDHLVKKAKLQDYVVPINIDRFGNTSAASIPLLMCSDAAHLAGAAGRIALLGYGAGFAWAGASIVCDRMGVVELLEV